MCGRYTHHHRAGSDPGAVPLSRSSPISRRATMSRRPSRSPIVRMVDGKRHFALVRWGLMPSWVKDPKAFTLLINARGESVTEKPAFRNAMKRRRCLFPADGFYEWKPDGRPQAAVLRAREVGRAARLRRPVGDLDRAERRGAGDRGHRHHQANRTLAPIHDRMPVIVPPEAFDLWLDCANGRRHDRGGADRAGAGGSARGLRGFDRRQPRGQRQSEAGRAGRCAARSRRPRRSRRAKRAPAKRAKKDNGQGALF